MLNENAKDFYEQIETCLFVWGGKELKQKALDVYACFSKNENLKTITLDVHKIIKTNYKQKGNITDNDILFFVLKRYLNFLSA